MVQQYLEVAYQTRWKDYIPLPELITTQNFGTPLTIFFDSLASLLMRPAPVCVTFGHEVRAVQSKSTPQLSLKGITGTGPRTSGNDAESIYCADDRPPCGYTLAPLSIGERDLIPLGWVGVFSP